MRAKVNGADMSQGSSNALVGIIDSRVFHHLTIEVELALQPYLERKNVRVGSYNGCTSSQRNARTGILLIAE